MLGILDWEFSLGILDLVLGILKFRKSRIPMIFWG